MLITNMLTAAKLQRIVSKRVFLDNFFAARKNAVIPKRPISKPAPAFRKSTVLKSKPFCKYCHPIARQKKMHNAARGYRRNRAGFLSETFLGSCDCGIATRGGA